MFERYTEGARRVIFFARYEASQDGDSCIRCAHLLVGIEREAPKMLREAGLTEEQVQTIRDSLKQGSGERFSASVEVPLDGAAKCSLLLATEAAQRLQSKVVEPVHLLWGIYHADSELKKKLLESGLTEEKLTNACQKYTGSEAIGSLAELSLPLSSRAGIGYDLHRLAEGRKLILGGVEVPFEKGPVGHSDGDVLSHAICDALLGAAGQGDIGTHFPDTDPKWKGVSSLLFLEHARKLLSERGLRILHIDAVVITERPKLGPHFPAMRETLAKTLEIAPEQINLKAKTHEGLGEIGRGEAIAAHAIVTLEKREAFITWRRGVLE
jgi:2-C-methyl-D-erythritol 2,4-cyclodiphosphate synthase